MLSDFERRRQREIEEDKEIEAWSFMTDRCEPEDCPKCGRHRLYKRNNGKVQCEKCNWVIDDQMYHTLDYI